MVRREIKFRGKYAQGHEWVYGHYYNSHSVRDDYDIIICHDEDGASPAEYKIKKQYLGQYTGLKDKNGKDVFEGDIYEAHGFKYKVMFVGGAFVGGIHENKCAPIGWTTKHNDDDSDMILTDFCSCCIEVIGNIHENPELLK